MTPRRFGWLALVVALLLPRSAAADELEVAALFFLLAGPPLTASTALTIYDAVKAAQDEPPAEAAGWVQAIGATPQALVLTGFATAGAVDDDDDMANVGLIFAPFAMMTTALGTHGIWTLAADDPDPSRMFFTASAIGINAPLTVWALGAGFAGGFSRPHYAIMQLVATAPVIGGSAYHLGIGGEYTLDAVVMTTWSSALFLHGAMSLMLPDLAVGRELAEDIAVGPTVLRDASPDGLAPGLVLSGTL